MALTITKDCGSVGGIFEPKMYGKGQITLVSGKFDFDASYPTGGELLDLSEHLREVLGVMVTPQDGYVFEYDYANKKVKAMYADYDAAAAGPLVEVADATDLSAVTGVRFLAWGIL